MKNESGYVYIMTNKAMPGLVKIGYARNVESRRRGFSNQSCIPYEFEVYRTFPTTKYAADKTVHTWFSPELRVNKSREFFNITPEYASSVIEKKIAEAKHISSTFSYGEKGTTDRILRTKMGKSDLIPYNGKTLVLEANKNVTCKVVGNRVEFKGKLFSLSNLTIRLHGGKNMSGPWGWWLCDGKPLHGRLNKRRSPWPKNEWNIDIPTENS